MRHDLNGRFNTLIRNIVPSRAKIYRKKGVFLWTKWTSITPVGRFTSTRGRHNNFRVRMPAVFFLGLRVERGTARSQGRKEQKIRRR